MRLTTIVAMAACALKVCAEEAWTIDTQDAWEASVAARSHLDFKDGTAVPTARTATFRSTLKTFDRKWSARSLVIEQSPVWENWEPIDNIGPDCVYDAPVLLSLGPGNYWFFARHNRGAEANARDASKGPFVAQPAHMEGFDIPLLTTPLTNQFRAPGALKPNLGGYHAWQSRDMINWVHHGPVTDRNSAWVTTAEYVQGQAYIYYDFCDYDPAGARGTKGSQMSVAWFTSPSLDQQFEFCAHIGHGHPDPDIGFAEGRFYLATQMDTDYASPGPWVERVEARVGVDTNQDGAADAWSDWQVVREHYDYIPGFAKQVSKTPAQMDLFGLPAGYGFQWEIKITDTTDNASQPILDKVIFSFSE